MLNASLGFAQQQLADHGEFYPYAAAIHADGQTEMIAGQVRTASEHPAAADIVASCVAQLASRQHAIRAAALRVLLPHTRRRKAITNGQIRASAGSRRIWSHS
jgi:hypothetical protein